MREKLRSESANQQLILDDVNYRVEWGKYQERIKKQQQEKVEKVGMNSIIENHQRWVYFDRAKTKNEIWSFQFRSETK